MHNKLKVVSITNNKLQDLATNPHKTLKVFISFGDKEGSAMNLIVNRALVMDDGLLYQCQTLSHEKKPLYIGFMVKDASIAIDYLGTYRNKKFITTKEKT